MSFAKIDYLVADAVATITLNDPERRNPLGKQMLTELNQALRDAKDDANVRAIVITGAGDRAFSAGADLNERLAPDLDNADDSARSGFVDVFLAATRLGKPLIGAINGHALAGGFGLALCCDMLVVSDSATFGTPEIKVGLWPMMIMSIITRNVGRKRSLELFMTGRRIDAKTALEWGIVNRVVPAASVHEVAHALAIELAQWSPLIMRLGRNAFYASDDMDYEEALDYLHSQLSEVSTSNDAREGAQAFLEKRPPRFTGT